MTISFEHVMMLLITAYGILYTAKSFHIISISTKPYFYIILLALMVFFVVFRPVSVQIKFLLGLSFIGLEPVLFLAPLLLLPKIVSLPFWRPTRINTPFIAILIYLSYSLFLMLATSIIELSLPNNIFWLIISAFGFLLYAHYYQFSLKEQDIEGILGFLKKLILIQIPILTIQYCMHQKLKPGDEWSGSFADAHNVGYYLFTLFLLYFLPPLLSRNVRLSKIFSIKYVFKFLILTPFIIMCDAKMIIAILTVAAFFYLLFIIAVKTYSKVPYISASKTIIFSLLTLTASPFIYKLSDYYLLHISTNRSTIKEAVQLYTQPEIDKNEKFGFSYKYIFLARIFGQQKEDNMAFWIFGNGPGKLGSRGSNMMAYDILYKDDNQFKLPPSIPPYSSKWAKKYMSDLWTENISETAKYRSTSLSFPFSGIASVKGETGIIGLTLYFLIIFSFAWLLLTNMKNLSSLKIKNWALVFGLLWLSLPLFMIIDNYQEKPNIMIPLFLVSAILLSRKQNKPHLITVK